MNILCYYRYTVIKKKIHIKMLYKLIKQIKITKLMALAAEEL